MASVEQRTGLRTAPKQESRVVGENGSLGHARTQTIMIGGTGTQAAFQKSVEIDQQAAKSFARYVEAILVVVPNTKNQEQKLKDVRTPSNMNPDLRNAPNTRPSPTGNTFP